MTHFLIEKIDWNYLLEKNLDYVNWNKLSLCASAISILEKNEVIRNKLFTTEINRSFYFNDSEIFIKINLRKVCISAMFVT